MRMLWRRENLDGSTPYSDLEKRSNTTVRNVSGLWAYNDRMIYYQNLNNEVSWLEMMLCLLYLCTHCFPFFSWAPRSKDSEGNWLRRLGQSSQKSMLRPLVYNGTVRITAGTCRAAKGTQHSVVCLFYKTLVCSVCKVPVGFVWFNSQLIWTVCSVSTMAATLWPQHTSSEELCQNKWAVTVQVI